jgi:cytochrome c biogenesis protein CcdA/thiol-disulfide isomerase/thioredoxin
MIHFVLAFLGGVLTILSPCILPVLPFVFTRAGEPFKRSGLPLLIGMAVTFAAVATLATVGGAWIVRANQWGRWAALACLLVLGLALLLPGIADRLSRPVVALGNKLSNSALRREGSPGASLLLGVATGLLWAPCAGPILGLILTDAALRGASAETSLELLTFAAGSAVALGAALLLGNRAFAALKRSLGAEEWVRRVLGAAVVLGAVAIALGLDTRFLARVSTASTTKLEETLFGAFLPERAPPPGGDGALLLQGPAMARSGAMMAGQSAMTAGAMMSSVHAAADALGLALAPMPPLDGATRWLNSAPLSREALRGKVVLIDFWTYSCINCIRTLPYVEAWYEKYRGQGLVVIGVHSPEFAFEKDVDNVRRAIRDFGVTYPVAVDNDFALWRAFANEYWPAHYFVDAQGNLRGMHFGEGEYDASERLIRQLLAEAGRTVTADLAAPNGRGAALASDDLLVLSPETYIGHERAERFASPGGQVPDLAHDYTAPPRSALNEWALSGRWTIGGEQATLNAAAGTIVFHFQARDLNLVLGRGADGERIRFRVRVDGAPPGEDRGTDIGADGAGVVDRQRLYQLVRQRGAVRDRTVEIEFLDPGVMAYAFTFG